MDVDARVEALQEELARAREQIARLEAALGMDLITPFEWGLTGAEMRLFGGLMARTVLTKAAAMAVLYRDFGRDEAEPKIVDVLVCKARKKLKPFGIAIETVWGQGYRLSAESKAEAQIQIERAGVMDGADA